MLLYFLNNACLNPYINLYVKTLLNAIQNYNHKIFKILMEQLIFREKYFPRSDIFKLRINVINKT